MECLLKILDDIYGPALDMTYYKGQKLTFIILTNQLSICSKIIKNLLYKQLIHILTKKQIIPDHLFGLRSHYLTTDQLHGVTEYISTALEQI